MASALLPGVEQSRATIGIPCSQLHRDPVSGPVSQSHALSVLLRCRCIPVRIDPMKSGPDSARVLLISAHGGKGMVFPKVRWLWDPLSSVLWHR
jgi:hypothetical protein